jgi:SAM-dependent methyltransferase
MQREQCSACDHDILVKFLDLDTSPVADAYAATAEESLDLERYPLQVVVCTRCYLVQLLEVLPASQLFGTGYSFYTSASPPLSRYHEKYAQNVLTKYPDLAGSYVLEVGCNDGDLLRHFQLAGCRTIGVDPALGPVEVARKRGLDVRVRPFGAAFAKDLRELTGPASLVLANHVLAHAEDVSDMLAGISTMLDFDGIAMIEVQYLPDLLVNNAFDLVYHEHRNFFSLTSLESAALRHGLHLLDVEFTMRQGGSIRATFTRAQVSEARQGTSSMVTHTERWLQTLGPYEGFQGRVNRIRERLWDLVVAEGDRVIAGYGAPAKATTLLNFCRMSGVLTHVIDTTPAKQGRYIPGTDIQIRDPLLENAFGINTIHNLGGEVILQGVDTYMLLAWNYLPEILNREKDFSGRWIVPIPSPMVF